MSDRVIVAMSGGVDSSVAALLLKRQGFEAVGVHMNVWCEERQGRGPERRQCCSIEDARDAERVCVALGIRFYVLNFQQEFQQHVVDYFCREYLNGRTPNPCLACNEHMKFRLLLEKALGLGGRYLATGHYAQIEERDGSWRLLKGKDEAKDQSYVLYMLGQRELPRLLFPVGRLTKREVRDLASEAGLPVAEKRDSVEVCFVPGDYRSFLVERFGRKPGDIVDMERRVIGRHEGVAYYTIGQRHGLGLGGGERLYVVGLDPDANRVVVGPEELLFSSCLVAQDVRWVAGAAPDGPQDAMARIRYRSSGAAAVVSPQGDSAEVRFECPQRAVTPGQAVVFYRGEEVLGGGIIEKVEKVGQRDTAYTGRRNQAL